MAGVAGDPSDLVISGVFDGDLSGGQPKGVELYASIAIADLSIYGVGTANNGGGTDGEEFTFPAVAVVAGTYIYFSNNVSDFMTFFGFAPDYTAGSMSINGDDAVELFKNGSVIDTYGDINTGGDFEVWDYTDSWAYRVNSTGPDATFMAANWTYGGRGGLDNETTNGTAANPMPIGTHIFVPGMTIPPTSGVGENNVTLTVTDENGNSSICVAEVTVLDTIAPTFTCPHSDVDNMINVPGCDAIMPDLVSLVTDAMDNCSVVSIVQNPLAGVSLSDEVGNVVNAEVTVTDASGNETTCIVEITVVDVDDPFFQNCPGPLTFGGDPDACGALANWPQPVAFDNCDEELEVTQTDGPISGSFLEVDSIYTERYLAEDADGNTAECIFTVEVLDTECPDFVTTLPLDETVTCDAIPEPFVIIPQWHTVDNCTDPIDVVVVYTEDTIDILCANTYTIKRKWTITDGSDNSCFHIQKVHVIDTVAPLFTEAPDLTISCEDSAHPDVIGYPTEISDNCSEGVDTILGPTFLPLGSTFSVIPGITMEFSDDSTRCYNEDLCCDYTYTITRTWVLTDECDNSSSDVQIISVVDETIPMAVCHDITVYLDENGEVVISANDVNNGSTDNCAPESSLTLSLSQTLFTCDHIGDNAVILNVSDPCDNLGACVATVTVLDTLEPVLECPKNLTITLDPGACETIQYFEAELLTDNCAIDSFSVIPNGIPFEIGTHVITITAIDQGGNEVQCTFDLTVEEYPFPVTELACNDQINISLNADCEALIRPDMILEGGPYACYDCYHVILEYQDGTPVPTSPLVTSEEVGELLVARILDTCSGSGNLCWGYVLVESKLFPEFICPADTNVVCNGQSDVSVTGEPIVTSCEGSVSIEYTDEVDNNGKCSDERVVITRTWAVTDESGNTTYCDQKITLMGFEFDQLEFPLNYDGNDNPSFTCQAVAENPLLTDPSSTGFPTIGGHELDEQNFPFCDYTIFTEDRIFEGCGGSYEILRTWAIRNICEPVEAGVNPIEHIQVIMVWDVTPPVAEGPEDITLSMGSDDCFANYAVPVPDVTAECSSFEYLVNTTGGNLIILGNGQYVMTEIPEGETILSYILFDQCGNVGEHQITITVIDDQAPTALCDENTVVSVTIDGTGLIYAETFDDGSHDNCNEVWFKVVKTGELCGTNDGFDGTFNNCITCGGLNAEDGDDDPIKVGTQVYFDDVVKYCCEEIGTEVGVTMRVFEVDPGEGPVNPARMRPGGDLFNTFNDCEVMTQVQDELPPVIACPPNITVSCDYVFDLEAISDPSDRTFGAVVYDGETREDITVSGHGNPNFPDNHVWGVDGVHGDNCGSTIVINVVVDIECGRGTVTRTFAAVDAAGKVASCQQVITFDEFNPFTDDNVDFPDDLVLEDVCVEDLMDDPTATGEPSIAGDVCADILVSYEDELFVNDPDACIKIFRTWKVLDWCQYDENTGAGIWTELQIIKLSNTIAPEFVGEAELVACDSTATGCEGYIDLVIEVSDDCSETLNVSYFIDAFNDGDVDIAAPGTDASGSYPFGDHKITWRAVDGCGNASEFEQLFSIQDCKKPSPKCFSGLVTVVMEIVGEVTIWASDFDAGSDDNCGDVTVSFSEDVDDTNITFDCEQLGTQTVEIWVTDSYGNQDYCETFLFIQDNNDVCGNISGAVAGEIFTQDIEGVEGVEVNLDVVPSTPYLQTETDDAGVYAFDDILFTEEYEISGFKNDDPMNGISTFDVVKIQKHLLGLELFDVAYKYLAADVNNTEIVTALDMVELRRLILGEYSEFPDNNSWRFVDVNQEWADITNPWPFDEVLDIVDLTEDDLDNNFFGVKVGDLTGDATPNSLLGTEDRTPTGLLTFTIADAKVKAGDRVQLTIRAAEFREILGYQMTWNLEGLEYVSIESGALNVTDGNIGTRRAEEGLVSMSWSEGLSETIADDEVLFTLRLRANESGKLSEMITLTDEITRNEAYSEGSSRLEVVLDWRTDRVEEEYEWSMAQNTPNPFDEVTVIEIVLAKASDVTITIADARGVTAQTIEREYGSGIHQVKIKRSDLNAGGVYIYEMTATPIDGTDAYETVKKMIVVD